MHGRMNSNACELKSHHFCIIFFLLLLLKEPAIQTVCLDLCHLEAALKTIEGFGDIHLLVNNAGIAILGPFEEAKLDDFDKYVFLF